MTMYDLRLAIYPFIWFMNRAMQGQLLFDGNPFFKYTIIVAQWFKCKIDSCAVSSLIVIYR